MSGAVVSDEVVDVLDTDEGNADLTNGNGSAVKGNRGRKSAKTGPDGHPIKRMVLSLSETDFIRVSNAVKLRTSPLFAKIYGGSNISDTGPIEETRGRVVAEICSEWHVAKEAIS